LEKQLQKEKSNDFPEDEPIAWCFGYDSLLASYAHKGKYVEINVPFRRVWNGRNSKARATFLGIQESKVDTLINGLIYPIFTKEEMAELELREQGSTKYTIDFENVRIMHEGLNSKMQSYKVNEKMEVFMFIPEEEYDGASAYSPVLLSYVDLCAQGFIQFIENEHLEYDPVRTFLATTHDWPNYFLNDRVMSRRPWKYESSHFIVDNYLQEENFKEIPPALFPEEFAVRFHDEVSAHLTLDEKQKYDTKRSYGWGGFILPEGFY